MLLGEFAPVVLEPLAVPLLMLAGCLFAFGLLYVLRHFVEALFATVDSAVSWIPWLGGKVTGQTHRIEKRVSNFLGTALLGLDGRIGRYFAALASSLSWLAREIRAHASLLWTLSSVILGSTVTEVLRNALRLLRYEITHLKGQALYALRHLHSIEAGTLPGLQRWTLPRVKELEHAIDVTIPRDIARLRSRTRAITDRIGKTFARIHALENKWAATAFAGAVAIALAALGASWIRCRNWNRYGRALCAADSGLIDALALDALLLVGGFSIVQLANDLLAVETEIVDGVKLGVRELRQF